MINKLTVTRKSLTYKSQYITWSWSASYAWLRFIKNKLENSLLEKRFSASILGCGIIKQKIFNHCFSFISFFDNAYDKLPTDEAEMVHQEI